MKSYSYYNFSASTALPLYLGISLVVLQLLPALLSRSLNRTGFALPESIPRSGRRALNRPRVLLADDYPAWLKAMSELLCSDFDVVGTAADGQALVSEANRLRPDLIVTDVSMPISSGIEAVHKLRDSGSTARVVFLSLNADEELVNACMDAGALGYVRKFGMKAHLVSAVRAALAGNSYIF